MLLHRASGAYLFWRSDRGSIVNSGHIAVPLIDDIQIFHTAFMSLSKEMEKNLQSFGE